MLDNATARVATLLRSKGVEVGDRVGVMLPNVPHFPIVFFGAQRAGGVVVPMNVLLKGREVGFYLEDSGAKLLLAWNGFAEAAEEGAAAAGAECVLIDPETFLQMLGAAEPADEVVARAPDDTAVILYTSGTTGTSKGAEPAATSAARAVDPSAEITRKQRSAPGDPSAESRERDTPPATRPACSDHAKAAAATRGLAGSTLRQPSGSEHPPAGRRARAQPREAHSAQALADRPDARKGDGLPTPLNSLSLFEPIQVA